MPLGDSLTSGTTFQGAYRNKLYDLLTTAGYNLDFVGTQTDANNPALPDRDHQGMGGYRIDQLQAGLSSWLGAIEDPDVILLMIGTNDFSANFNVASAQDRLASLVADLTAKRPFAKIILSNLPLRTDDANLEAQQSAFNAALPGIVADLVSQGRQVSLLDMHSVLQAGDFEEGVHPSQAGYDKMANAWFSAMGGVITPLGTSNPPAITRVGPASDAQHITVTFSKPLADSAANPAFFSINGGLGVSQAVLDAATKRTITLTTGSQAPGTLYTLAVSGVRDRTPQQNLIAAGTTATFSSATIANGGFEAGETGWTMTGNYLVYGTNPPYVAAEGSTMLVLNGAQTTPNAVISQSFATVPGQSYELAFDVGIRSLNNSAQTLGVELNGTGSLLTKTESLFGDSSGDSVWTARTHTFTADSTSTTLTFRDLSLTGDGLDLLLDHVRVTAVPPNLLANGSFENGETGWTMAGNYLVYDTDLPYSPVDGDSILVFNGGQTPPNGSIAQTFATVPGNSYTLDFHVGTLALNYAEQRLGVDVSGSAALLTRSESLFGNSLANSIWTARSYTFTADSTSTTLTFRDLSATSENIDLMLDHVRITEIARISNTNTAPVAAADSYSTNQNTALVVPAAGVLANDSDAQANPLTAVLNSNPSHGSLTLNSNGGFTYTPATGYSGPDSFTYHANDGSLDSSVATVSISVNATNTAPTAVADSYSTPTGTALVVAPAGVLANDSDAQANPLTAVLNTNPGHGSLTLNSNGGFTYTPATGYSGPDSFTYHANDGSLNSNIVTVSLSVIAASTDILANGSFESNFTGWTTTGNLAIESAAPYAATDGTKLVAFNGHDLTPNGTLSQTFATVPGQTYTLSFDAGVLAYVKRHQKLTVSVTGSGSLLSQTISIRGNKDGSVIWTSRQFSFTANSATTTLVFRDRSTLTNGIDLLLDNVHVVGPPAIPNGAPVASADFYSVNKDTALVVPSSGILANDVDPQSHAMTAVKDTGPKFGTLTLNANGGFTYQPDSGFTGTDSFTYHAKDATQDSNSVTVSITVNQVPAGLLANPSFESGFSGWATTGNQTIEYYSPTDGVRIADFNSQNKLPNATLAQTFATTPGKAYSLNFDAGVLAYTTDTQTLQVAVSGTGSLLSQTITLLGDGSGDIRWLAQNFTFVADSTSTTLSFSDLSIATVGIDLLLDNVRVAAQAPAVATTTSLSGINPGTGPSFILTPTECVISMIAPKSGDYVLERSEDLQTWEQVDGTYRNQSEPIEFIDARDSSGVKPRMFYRIGGP